jgi:tRNA threonylcarbamoyladenosine biosynthesis protein TsaE
MIEVLCPLPADTAAVAHHLAVTVEAGDVIVLNGPLGSGKTLFAAALADALGVEEQVVSPSFVLVRRYDSGVLPFVHADVYRLRSINEFDDLDLLGDTEGAVVVIEWGASVLGALPSDHLLVELQVEPDGARRVRLLPSGSWRQRDLSRVGAGVRP